MTDFKHTPGPWYTDGSVGEIGVAICWKDDEGGEVLIADVFGIDDAYDLRDPRIIANARLIAAAPEMAALLFRWAYSISDKDDTKTRSDARALLARIKGETE